jgi:hypothetical protein
LFGVLVFYVPIGELWFKLDDIGVGSSAVEQRLQEALTLSGLQDRAFVVVDDDQWRFDPEALFAALRDAYAGQEFWPVEAPLYLQTMGFSDGWGVRVDPGGAHLVVQAGPQATVDLVAWVRAFVPDDVALSFFDDQVSFGVADLPPGITPGRIRAEYFPDAWQSEQLSSPPEEHERFVGPPRETSL